MLSTESVENTEKRVYSNSVQYRIGEASIGLNFFLPHEGIHTTLWKKIEVYCTWGCFSLDRLVTLPFWLFQNNLR